MKNNALLTARLFSFILITIFTYSCNKSEHLPSAPTRLDKIVFDSLSVNMATITFSYNANNQVQSTHFSNINNGVTAHFTVQYGSPTQVRYVNANEPREYELYELSADRRPLTREMSAMNYYSTFAVFLYTYKYNSNKELDSVIVTNKSTGAAVGWYKFDYTNGNITRITQPIGGSTYSTEITYDNNTNYYRNTNPDLFMFMHNIVDTETNYFGYFFSRNNPRTFKRTENGYAPVVLNITPTTDQKVAEYNYNGHVEYKTSFHYATY
jgi:hypothetical protein